MKVLIVGILTDPKRVELTNLAQQAGLDVRTNPHDHEAEARAIAAKVAGRPVRVPYFFVGDEPGEGKPWPRERAGGAKWFEKWLNTGGPNPAEPEKPTATETVEQATDAAAAKADPPPDPDTARADKLKAERAKTRDLRKQIKDKDLLAQAQVERISDLEELLKNAREFGNTYSDRSSQQQAALVGILSLCDRTAERVKTACEILRKPYRELNGFEVDHAMHDTASALSMLGRIHGEAVKNTAPVHSQQAQRAQD